MALTSNGGAPSSSVAPPWLRDGRSRRSGALRRAQYHRAEARVIGKLLQHFAALQHRGCCRTRLGAALELALSPGAAAAAPAPSRPPGIFYAKGADAKDVAADTSAAKDWGEIDSLNVQQLQATAATEASAAKVWGEIDSLNDQQQIAEPNPLDDMALPTIHAELETILSDEIDAQQPGPCTPAVLRRKARLWQAIDIIYLARACNR